jgi:predicted nucleic acid-binding protein
VVDASASLSWALPDEQDESRDRILTAIQDGRIRVVVPELWCYEVMNAVRYAVRRGRLAESDAVTTIRTLWTFVTEFVSIAEHGASGVLQTALGAGLTVYDAAYVALARERGADLVTWDKQLLGLSCPGVRVLSPEEFSA